MPTSKHRKSRKHHHPGPRPRRRAAACGCGGVDPADWAFPVPPDTLVVACRPVIGGAAPIRLAMCEEDEAGEMWTFTCGGQHTGELAEWGLVHLLHLVEAQPALQEVADLEPDEVALLDLVTGRWTRVDLTVAPEDERDLEMEDALSWQLEDDVDDELE